MECGDEDRHSRRLERLREKFFSGTHIAFVCGFTFDSTPSAEGMAFTPGGPALYSSVAALYSGAFPELYAVYGKDYPREVLELLRASGIGTKYTFGVDKPTPTFVFPAGESRRESMRVVNRIRLDDCFSNFHVKEDLAYFSFTHREIGRSTLERLAAGKRVFADLQGFTRVLDVAGRVRMGRPSVDLRLCEFVKGSVGEFGPGRASPRRLLRRGVREVLVTDGAMGATLYTQDGIMHCSLPEPKGVLSALGAGDVFGSAYFVKRLAGCSYEESMRWATALAYTHVTRGLIQFVGRKQMGEIQFLARGFAERAEVRRSQYDLAK